MPLPPGMWPEDATPCEHINCQKCLLSLQRSRIVWGEGNPDADIFILLDNPGAREDWRLIASFYYNEISCFKG